MHLAWLLAALCGCEAAAAGRTELRSLADWTYARIAANQSDATGLFYGSAAREGWLRRRRPLSTLSSQTYPMYALARYGQVFGVREAIARAARCADALCRLQGPAGQWWWRYNVQSGEVVETHPVYAVNQDTAIPLAFHEIEAATGADRYGRHVAHGLEWLFGANELGASLVDEARSVIWRAIGSQAGRFAIVSEMHSYHPARCLFALLSAASMRPEEVAR
jgi:hypothetical protein